MELLISGIIFFIIFFLINKKKDLTNESRIIRGAKLISIGNYDLDDIYFLAYLEYMTDINLALKDMLDGKGISVSDDELQLMLFTVPGYISDGYKLQDAIYNTYMFGIGNDNLKIQEEVSNSLNIIMNGVKPNNNDKVAIILKLKSMDEYNRTSSDKVNFSNKNILIGTCKYNNKNYDCLILPESIKNNSVDSNDLIFIESSLHNGSKKILIVTKGIDQVDSHYYYQKI